MIHGITSKIQPSLRTGIKRSFQIAAIIAGLSLPLNYAIQRCNQQNDTFQTEQADLSKNAEKGTKKNKILGLIGLGLLSVGAGSVRHDDIESKYKSKE